MKYEAIKPIIDDLKMRTKQDAFSLKINETITVEMVLSLGLPTNLDEENKNYSPVVGTFALDIEPKEAYMCQEDYRFDALFYKNRWRKKDTYF